GREPVDRFHDLAAYVVEADGLLRDRDEGIADVVRVHGVGVEQIVEHQRLRVQQLDEPSRPEGRALDHRIAEAYVHIAKDEPKVRATRLGRSVRVVGHVEVDEGSVLPSVELPKMEDFARLDLDERGSEDMIECSSLTGARVRVVR